MCCPPNDNKNRPPNDNKNYPINDKIYTIQPKSLSSIIGSYKSICSKIIHQNNKTFGRQSRYHDHIIRNNDEFEKIKYYIQTNPKNWNKDLFRE